MAEEQQNKLDLKGVIYELVQSGEKELNQGKMKIVKKICRNGECYITEAYTLLMRHLRRNHSEVRYSALQIIVQLFQRSHQFRLLVVEALEEFLSLTVETDSKKPLPPPKQRAKLLKQQSMLILKVWVSKYGDGYKKLKLGYNFLKHVKRVNFNDMEGRNETERLRDEQKKERLDNIWRERVKRVKAEMEEECMEMENCLRQTNNSLGILIPALDDFYVTEVESIQENDGVEPNCYKVALNNKDLINLSHSDEDDYSTIPADVRENGLVGKAGGVVKVDLVCDAGGNEFDSAVEEVVVDQYQTITKSKLPMAKKWVTILTRAGGVADQDLLKKSIDIRKQLGDVIKKILGLGLNIENKRKQIESSDSDEEAFVEVEEKPSYELGVSTDGELCIPFTQLGPSTSKCCKTSNSSNATTWKIGSTKYEDQDPTTWAATIRKVADKPKHRPTSISESYKHDFAYMMHDVGHSDKKTDDKVKVPVIRLEEPSQVYVDTERAGSRFWVSSCRDGEAITVPQSGATHRVIEFTGKFEPVLWSCRAPLPSGRLCPRKDRVKCPLHGAVVARDKMGTPNGEEKHKVEEKIESQAWRDEDLQRDIEAATGQSLVPKSGHGRGRGLTDVKKENSRSRLETKVFNRSSMKRVANSLDKFDSKKFKEKFYDQFNCL